MNYRNKRSELYQQVQAYLPVSAKRSASRDQKLVAALCHLSILLNLFTGFAGIAVCAFFYLLARGRARFVEEQAAKALIFQAIIGASIFCGGLIYKMIPDWLGGVLLMPFAILIWFVAIVLTFWRAARCL